ncbi:MAG: MoxR family ATPase [Oscillospiraceae bacterium]|jgi:MoxR-like ATPase|nr:MoxR family ATPase [Oscillospiraceae bacterium]
MKEKLINIISEAASVVIGKDKILRQVMMAVIARGHILIEDIPGVGKTTMALAFSRILSLDYNRMQFTPDVMPSDIVGFSVYNKVTGNFDYKPGVIACNLFLADEINRTSSKTQSALLETMEEGTVTVDGVTRALPKPFIVIATQNPIGSVGTHMLPDSQLDRFMIRLSLGYPDVADEVDILKSRHRANPLYNIEPLIGKQDILKMQTECESTFLNDKMYRYIASLAAATRTHPLLKLGISPRGSLALVSMAKAAACINNRDYVIPDDVHEVFYSVCGHRIVLSPKAKLEGTSTADILGGILKDVKIQPSARSSLMR